MGSSLVTQPSCKTQLLPYWDTVSSILGDTIRVGHMLKSLEFSDFSQGIYLNSQFVSSFLNYISCHSINVSSLLPHSSHNVGFTMIST